MSGLRSSRHHLQLPQLSPARLAWRFNAASLGAATVIATVAVVEQTRWGAMLACTSILAFLASALAYRLAQLPVRTLRP